MRYFQCQVIFNLEQKVCSRLISCDIMTLLIVLSFSLILSLFFFHTHSLTLSLYLSFSFSFCHLCPCTHAHTHSHASALALPLPKGKFESGLISNYTWFTSKPFEEQKAYSCMKQMKAKKTFQLSFLQRVRKTITS